MNAFKRKLLIIINSYSFSIIYKCWKLSADDRPPFEALSSAFTGRLQAVAGYMEVQMVLELQGNGYYGDPEFIMFFMVHADG